MKARPPEIITSACNAASCDCARSTAPIVPAAAVVNREQKREPGGLKKKLALPVTSAKVDGRGAVYWIA